MKNADFRKIVLDVLNTFMRRTGMSKTRLGNLALNDPTFVAEFTRGLRDPRLSTVQRLLTFVNQHRPSKRLKKK